MEYYGFDGRLYKGQLVADKRTAHDLQQVFLLMYMLHFPLESVIPIVQFGWDDFESMRQNNTSAFNYRTVPFSGKLSNHAYGLAVDFNPVQNPYYTGDKVFPEGAAYNAARPGTLHVRHPVVRLFKVLGWRWGGDWGEKDYQHFDKPLEKIEVQTVQNYFPWPIRR